MQICDNERQCGRNGRPGWRDKEGRCVSWKQLKRICGDPPNPEVCSFEVRPSRLSGTRKIVDAVFTYTNRNTGVDEKYFVRVDVTEKFPFLVTKISPYYDR